MSLTKVTEESKWNRGHTFAFLSFGIGLFLEGYIFSLAPIASAWFTIPSSLTKLLLAWPYLWLIIGIAIYGPLSDRIGRKRTFYISMSMYAVGGILLLVSPAYVAVLIALAILLLAAGGEMNTIMIASHEIFPRKHRSKAMMMEMDFLTLSGVALAAIGFLSASTTVAFGRETAAALVFCTLAALLLARRGMPESVRWLEKKGLHERAKAETQKYYGETVVQNVAATSAATAAVAPAPTSNRNPPTWFRYAVATTVAWANTTGFGLLTYALGPLYFPSLTPYIFLIAGVAGTVGGFVGLGGDRWSRKTLLTVSSLFNLIITIVIATTVHIWVADIALFWTLLVLLNLSGQVNYMTEDTLKGELWQTQRRGSITALARVVSIGLYIPILYITSTFPVSEYLIFNASVWAIGAIAAVSWQIWGVETGKGVSIGYASGETETVSVPVNQTPTK
ncbi:MAG: MFS transporter [Thermoprotei archaeon]